MQIQYKYLDFKEEGMATVKLILERSRVLNSGKYPIVFQIIYRRSKKLIYTSFHINEEEFNTTKERVIFISNDIKKKNEVSYINSQIKRQRKSIDAHIQELENRGCDYLVADISSRFRIEHDSLSLMGYFDSQIERKQEMGKLGTIRAYKTTRNSIAKFINYRHVRISDVNFAFIALHTWHVTVGLHKQKN